MLTIRKILIPTDLSRGALRAFDMAYALAERHDAELHALYISDREASDSEVLREELDSWLEESSLDHASDHQLLQWAHRSGTQVPPAILEYAGEEDIDLIVIGTHGHRSLAHPALGGTTGEVVRRARCPVLTIRADKVDEGIVRSSKPPSFQRILVPVDFSEHAEHSVQVARYLADLYQASLFLLFVAEERTVPLFNDTGIPGITTLKMDPDITSRADEALKQLIDTHPGPAVDASYHVHNGHPASEVLDFAEEHAADLIVMSTHGQTGHSHFSLGSVTEKVVRKAACPVLTLKAFGKSLLT